MPEPSRMGLGPTKTQRGRATTRHVSWLQSRTRGRASEALAFPYCSTAIGGLGAAACGCRPVAGRIRRWRPVLGVMRKFASLGSAEETDIAVRDLK